MALISGRMKGVVVVVAMVVVVVVVVVVVLVVDAGEFGWVVGVVEGGIRPN